MVEKPLANRCQHKVSRKKGGLEMSRLTGFIVRLLRLIPRDVQRPHKD